jgi:O-antigen/teichoic acid export membrane protein
LRDLFGANFAGASTTLIILLVSALPTAVVAAFAPVAGLVNRRSFAVAALLALILNAGANFAVVPRFGIAGAAWVNDGSQLFLACWLVRLVARKARAVPEAIIGRGRAR